MRPILVSGSNRSGTTWMGKIISHHKSIRYINEPMNPVAKKYRVAFNGISDLWYPHINDLNEDKYFSGYNKLIQGNIILPENFSKINKTDFYNFILINKNLFNKRKTPLFKDPIALFSADWLFKKFNMRVIIMIRRPEAYTSSLIKNSWDFDFNNFLKQKLFFQKNNLSHYLDEIEYFSKNQQPILDQGILLWNIFYEYINTLRNKYLKDWLFIKHEDISKDPINNFSKVFEYLNLELDQKIKEYILDSSNNLNSTERDDNQFHLLKRNSSKLADIYKKRLNKKQIIKIKNKTSKVRKLFGYD